MVLSPALLTPGMVILRHGRALTLTQIRSSKDPVHIRLFYLVLEDEQGVVRVTCRDGAEFAQIKEATNLALGDPICALNEDS